MIIKKITRKRLYKREYDRDTTSFINNDALLDNSITQLSHVLILMIKEGVITND